MNPYERAVNDAEIDLRKRIDRICMKAGLTEAYKTELLEAVTSNVEIIRYAKLYYDDGFPGV